MRKSAHHTALWAGAGAAMALVLLALVLGRLARRSGGGAPALPASACSGAEERLRATWNGARKGNVHSALLASRLPYAESTAATVERMLDAYADTWGAQHAALCRTSPPGDGAAAPSLEVRLQCLEHHRRQLETLVHALAEADARMLQGAAEAVADLPGSEDCAEVAALASRVRPPATVAQRARVDELRGQLAELSTLMTVGHSAQALERLQPLAQEIQALRYPPLEAEALLIEGRLLSSYTGDFHSAEQTLLRAVHAAEAGRHDRVAAEAWMELSTVQGEKLAHREQGLEAIRHAESLLQALDFSGNLQFRLLTLRGLLLWGEGKSSEALGQLQMALQLAEALYPPDSIPMGHALNNVGLALKEQGSHEQALVFLRQSLAILEKALGPANPRLASPINRIGLILFEEGKYDQARAFHERGLALREAALGRNDPSVGAALLNVAQDLAALGEYPAAMKLLDRALAIHYQAFGSTNLRVAGALLVLEQALIRQGRYDEAAAHIERALAIIDQAVGSESSLKAVYLSDLGDIQRGKRRFAEARAYYERAARIREREAGAFSPLLVKELTRQAEMSLRLGNAHAAVPALERALKLLETEALAPEQRAETRFVLAQALWEGSAPQRRRACTLARSARQTLDEAVGDPPMRKELEAWLSLHHRCP